MIEISEAALDTLLAEDPGGPVVMLNLLRFRPDGGRETYGRYMDTSDWDEVTPEEWASRIVRAVERDDDILGPGGKTALAKLASRGPAFLLDALSSRMFSRDASSR